MQLPLAPDSVRLCTSLDCWSWPSTRGNIFINCMSSSLFIFILAEVGILPLCHPRGGGQGLPVQRVPIVGASRRSASVYQEDSRLSATMHFAGLPSVTRLHGNDKTREAWCVVSSSRRRGSAFLNTSPDSLCSLDFLRSNTDFSTPQEGNLYRIFCSPSLRGLGGVVLILSSSRRRGSRSPASSYSWDESEIYYYFLELKVTLKKYNKK